MNLPNDAVVAVELTEVDADDDAVPETVELTEVLPEIDCVDVIETVTLLDAVDVSVVETEVISHPKKVPAICRSTSSFIASAISLQSTSDPPCITSNGP
jgi:hypothetical protein